jgi:hypothetical protein
MPVITKKDKDDNFTPIDDIAVKNAERQFYKSQGKKFHMDSETILESDKDKLQVRAQKSPSPTASSKDDKKKAKPNQTMKTGVKEADKSKAKAKVPEKKKAESESKAESKEDAGIFGGDDDSKADDPYAADEVSKADLLVLDSFADEEKKAMSSPLKASEMKKMEQGSDALFKEITAGLKGVSDSEYNKAKKFF